MKILRIPNRYKKQLSRLNDKDRLFIYDSLMKLSIGENVKIPDNITGDILELIWRDSIQMEKKNSNFDENLVGNLLAGNPAGNSHTEVKGNEVKCSEVKGNEYNIEFLISEYEKIFNKKIISRNATRINKLKARLKTFTQDQLIKAWNNMSKDMFLCGDNDKGKFYATFEYCTRNDDNIEKYLENYKGEVKEFIWNKKIHRGTYDDLLKNKELQSEYAQDKINNIFNKNEDTEPRTVL